MDNEKSTSEVLTFWKLINQYEIEIPKLQRDYAQGRDENNVKQIRDVFLEGFKESLLKDKPMELNFIYGQVDNQKKKFIPIDGQQRLTSLFLLYFYIFKRADNHEELLKKLSNFVYATRDSSLRFCDNILNERETSLQFNEDSLSSQIYNCNWFTGNYFSDPTVESMLRMLDCIHHTFKDKKQFNDYKEKLISENCPISFLWLKMDDFQRVDDLYIKMNARGKLLSDFEILKAKLQSSSILSKILENDTQEERINFVSRFNNEYTELFFANYNESIETSSGKFSDSLIKFDNAMFNFIKFVIETDYFVLLSQNGVNQKQYRDDSQTLSEMNGSILFNFIEKGFFDTRKGRTSNDLFNVSSEDTKEEIIKSITKINNLLTIFYNNKKNLSIEKKQLIRFVSEDIQIDYFDETIMFKSFNKTTKTYTETVTDYAILNYLNKFGYPKTQEEKEGYDMFKRIVSNLSINGDFITFEYSVDAMANLKRIIDNISENKIDCVFEAIKRNSNTCAAFITQMDEEKQKIELINSDKKWWKEIFEAEYYYNKRQIGFLLDYATNDSGVCDIDTFNKYFSVSKRVLTEDKRIQSNIKWQLLERAMLCLADPTVSQTSFLRKNSNTSTAWGFLEGKYDELLSNAHPDKIEHKNKRNIFKELLDELSECNLTDTLKKLVDSYSVFNEIGSKNEWKNLFIKNEILEDYNETKFGYNIDLKNNTQGATDVLLLSGQTSRSYSMEIHTYLLYKKLIKNGIDKSFLTAQTDYTGEMIDSTNTFPLRYYYNDSIKIGYILIASSKEKCFVIYKDNSTKSYTEEEVISLIKKEYNQYKNNAL